MTILPLVGRELRVRARSPAGYWTRFAAALAGTLFCVLALTMNANQTLMGTAAFEGLVVAAFILCCFAGFLTVDGISRERREGTLGLLFLTRVTALDVLLGNFGAAGIASLCALAAFVPVLIVPVLAGGVSGAEAMRKGLALFDMMILSLAAGLWASARGREWWASARSAARVLVLVIFVPALLGSPFPLVWLPEYWWPGPLSALSAAGDVTYRKSAAPYWISIAVVHAISWLLMIGAANRLRRARRQEDDGPINRRIKSPKPKPLKETEAPLEWLLRRQRGMKSVVWAGVSIRTFFYGAFWLFIAINRGVWIGYSWGVVLAFSLAENCLFAWVASRFFVAARHTGELELLMTTPEGARTIVTSQWKWLKHLFRWPIVVLVAPWVLLSINGLGRQQATFAYFSASLTVLNTVAGVVALLWAGLWFGWSERSQARAVVRIVLLAVAAPYLLGQLLLRAGLLFNPPRVSFDPFSPWRFLVLTSPQIVNLLFFLWLIRWCRRRLDAEVGHVPVGGGIGEQIALYLRGFLSYHD